MKNRHIRWIFLLSAMFTVGIVLIQVFWVRKAYMLEDKEFNMKAFAALRNTTVNYWEWRGIEPSHYDVVNRIQPDYYVVQINDEIDEKLLSHILRVEFEKVHLITDIEFCFYDCMLDSVMASHFIDMTGSNKETHEFSSFEYPKLSRDNYYIGVHFPNRKEFVFKNMGLWYFSTFFILLLLIFLTYVLSLILKQKRLREVQKEFVNNMTHEFKTPLSSIQLAAEVLKKPEILNKPQRLLSYATIIDNEAVRLAKHVERVLQMANAEKGEIILNKEKINLNRLIITVVEKFQDKFDSINGEISLHLPDKDVEVFIDALHIENVFSNLLDNAMKYRNDKKLKVDIELSILRKKAEVRIADNGIGIAEEHQKLLFDKFYRVPTGNIHNVKGFGLGLNYVDIIIKAHDGNIKLESVINEGSTFIISLPLLKG
ncbi:MAG TPA: HAMP domain-containing sensor histidine kinase [Chitinophagaceae bacterium]|nr:HAMP domain-containing sensor histidine kinase [Chitinophagaceae bacterium]